MNVSGIEFFDDLIEIHNEQNSIPDKYPKLRYLLERVCKDLTAKETIQFSNLFSRLNYVCERTKLDRSKTYQLNTLRINANNVLHSGAKPTQEDYFENLKALSNALSHFYGINIPKALSSILPKNDSYRSKQRQTTKFERIRIEVTSTDGQYIYAFDEDNPTQEPIKIKHHIPGINEEFNSTIEKIWEGCQLNLIDVTVNDDGIYIPNLIILEPDYLLDISSLAECMQEYSQHPLNYIISKFEPVKNTAPILLGNAANIFLDEFVNEQSHAPVVYSEVMKKLFKSAPFEFSTCSDLLIREKEIKFFEDTQIQYQNIRTVVNNVFPQKNIDRDTSILEPNFICEHLGVQGRLDFLQKEINIEGNRIVIELKSGRAGYPNDDNPEVTGRNHRSQLFIYQIILQKVLGYDFHKLESYLLYSRYTNTEHILRNPRPYMAAIKEILNVRNLIVANERSIADDSNEVQTKAIIKSVEPNIMAQQGAPPYVARRIDDFQSCFKHANNIDLEYFHNFYSFVTKEHYISKAGEINYESTKGISSLWLSSLKEKKEAGEILTDLIIIENLTGSDIPTIKLKIPIYDHDFLPNFRQGDIVILYERNDNKDSVTNKQIFKGSIQELRPTEIIVRFRYKQRNQSVFPRESKYAIEHDFLDSSYNSMYRGLYAFLQSNSDRRDLLLGRKPEFNAEITLEGDYSTHNGIENKDINPIILKAKQAKDYFLLVGPPGTGKTSIALKSLVEEFYNDLNNNILLLSYTNRAVDEICDALDNTTGNPDYIRIGTELSCSKNHRKRLLNKVIKDCESRSLVKSEIQRHRIFVGTVASFSGKTEIFKLKRFQVAIIDEASQILEPSLMGILSAKNEHGGNAIDKFILIGDHKQLSAIVLQNEKSSTVANKELRQIGILDRKQSLFERLYNVHKHDMASPVWGMLHKQGRMHPDIALFPNYSFYNGQLEIVPRVHQISNLDYKILEIGNQFHNLISTKRIAFIPSEKNKLDRTNKSNTYEAKIVKELVKQIFALYRLNGIMFLANESIGIITPFRNQIALIKREIHDLNIPELNDITVDTVERFQGSQRDIMIFSFSINQFYQLDYTTNNIEDDGQIIDRKLNVAITRAKKQLFVVGNPSILSNNLIYYRFIEFIRSKSGFINSKPEEFLTGNFTVNVPDTDIEIGNNVYEPDIDFKDIFDRLVTNPLRNDLRTPQNENWYKRILGNDNDYNRMNLIGYGRADFSQNQQTLFGYTLADRVNLYCYFNMRKHYFTSLAIFKGFRDYFKTLFANSNYRITFIDFGCGPLTSGLAFNQSFADTQNYHFDYIGIDISAAMLNKANEFSKSGLFSKDTTFQFVTSIREVSENYWQSVFTLPTTVILNFSYLFGNLTKDVAEKLAVDINALLDKYQMNKYISVFQNSSVEKRNRSYHIFKKLVPGLASVSDPKTETVVYRNSVMSNYDKSESVYYELLSN